jgi:branched-subunit amino acid aminotransferase/4-amino-4-deoxychorismate lyase
MADAVLRLTVSRGVGPRGYSPKGGGPTTIVMSLHPAPPRETAAPAWRVVTSRLRLSADDPLARFKTCNKLVQIMARAEADAAGADEALLLNSEGQIVEGSGGNVFWIEQETVCTPSLKSGPLPGVTRAVVFELCALLGWSISEKQIHPKVLIQAAGVFFTLSSMGITEAVALDGEPLQRSSVTTELRRAYFELVDRETHKES